MLARRVALGCINRINEGGWSNIVVSSAISKHRLSGPDAGAVTAIVNETIRRARRWDAVITAHSDRPLKSLDPELLNALRMGAAQIIGLEVAHHAAVSTTVEVCSKRYKGFVNAVLRKVAADPLPLPDPDTDQFGYWGMTTGLPDWILRVCRTADPADWTALATSLTRPAPTHLRVDPGASPPPGTVEHPHVPGAWIAPERVPDPAPGIWFQDAASVEVANTVAALGPARVIDLCAGRGGKTTALAARGIHVAAVEPVASRAAAITRSAGDLTELIEVHHANAMTLDIEPADVVLVDAPCSGLGTLRRRPEIAHRIKPEHLAKLASVQAELLARAHALVKPGGHVVYSVCTFTPEETTGVAEGDTRQLLPHTHDTDGMFISTRSTS